MTGNEIAEKSRAGPRRGVVKGIRIAVLLSLILVLLYFAMTFRVIVIPDDYVVLDPLVLPRQYWVVKRAQTFDRSFNVGDIIYFTCNDKNGKTERHLSLLVGMPGQKVEHIPEKRIFKVDMVEIQHNFNLSDDWTHTAHESVVLGRNEFLLIDNNTIRGDRKFWLIDGENIIGKFIFQMPF